MAAHATINPLRTAKYEDLPTDGSAFKYLEEVAEPEAQLDPRYARYDRKVARHNDELLLRTHTEAIGAHIMLSLCALYEDAIYLGHWGANTQDEVKLELHHALRNATTYLWRREMVRAIQDAKLPNDARLDAEHVPHRLMLWLLDGEHYTLKRDGDPHADIYALLLLSDEDHMHVVEIGTDMTPEHKMVVMRGSTAWHDEEQQAMLRSHDFGHDLMAGMSFLASPYIPKEELRPTLLERDQVKRARRRGARPRDCMVTVVCLPTSPSTGGGGGGGDGESRYSVRWLVRGHHRMQPYGKGRLKRRLRWIPPHVKGPDGAPMKHTVYDVKA